MRTFRYFLAAAAIAAIVIILLISSGEISFSSAGVRGLDIRMDISLSDRQRSSIDLTEKESSFFPYNGERFSTGSHFAYLWLNIFNNTPEDQQIMLSNRQRNYYTELLIPAPLGSYTVYRQGDTVPVSDSPVRHHRTVFPLLIPAGSSLELILEYHGPRGVSIEPEWYYPADFLARVAFERGFVSIVYGILIALLLMNTFTGLSLKQYHFIAFALFSMAVMFFTLRQSRLLLLLIDPHSYPEWLFPFSIFFNIAGGSLFFAALLKKHLLRWTVSVLIFLGILSIIFTSVSLFAAPYRMADLLNMVSFCIMILFLTVVYRAVRNKDEEVITLALAFSPWAFIMATDIFSEFFGVTDFLFADYRQLLGFTASQILITFTLIFSYKNHCSLLLRKADQERQAVLGMETNRQAAFLDLKTSLLRKTAHQLRQPIDSIIASAGLLAAKFPDPRVVAAGSVIMDEAMSLRRTVTRVTDINNPQEEPLRARESSAAVYKSSTPGKDIPAVEAPPLSVIWIFDSDQNNASRVSLLLQTEGYQVEVVDNRYKVLQGAINKEMDILLIDPESMGEEAFSLAVLIREQFNMLYLPILMICSYHTESLMKKGYAAGANDFIVRPFDPRELTARVQTLTRLTRISHRQKDLSRSEKEKNVFLYFLTHNINTPLTLLINRVKELKELIALDDLEEITSDMHACIGEIHDIVRNVLLSFQLSDGRYSSSLKIVKPAEILQKIVEDLEGKAKTKKQEISLLMAEKLPPIQGDTGALRGILYNLVDNSIKFTPSGGNITIEAFDQNPFRVDVHDTGPGIPADEREKLFQRFERLSPKPTAGEPSTGLGLYVARELCVMMGGSLGYVEKDKGACFVLTIPSCPPDAGDQINDFEE